MTRSVLGRFTQPVVEDPPGRDEHSFAGVVVRQGFALAQLAQPREVVGVAVGDEHRVDHHRAGGALPGNALAPNPANNFLSPPS